jgi:DNA-binding beta-propeller fold protein YncE
MSEETKMKQLSREAIWPVVAGLMTAISSAMAPAADKPTLELVKTIELKGRPGKLDHLALDAKNDRLFVANKSNNTLDIVDLKAGKLLRQIPAQQGIQGIAYAADLDRIFVGLGQGGYCNVFDGKDYKLLKSVKFQDDSDNVRYHPKTNLVYVAHAENALGVIDAKTFEVKADIKLPATAEAFSLETGRPRLYVNVTALNQVVVIDTESDKITATYPLKLAGANYTMALDEADHRLFIGCRKPPLLVVLDTESGKEITSVPIGGEVDDLFFDAKGKRLYAISGEGVINVIRQVDADKYESVEKVTTEKTAKTGLLDAAGGRLFLAVPRLTGKDAPEIRVYKVLP